MFLMTPRSATNNKSWMYPQTLRYKSLTGGKHFLKQHPIRHMESGQCRAAVQRCGGDPAHLSPL